jgi:hypothetical protein
MQASDGGRGQEEEAGWGEVCSEIQSTFGLLKNPFRTNTLKSDRDPLGPWRSTARPT